MSNSNSTVYVYHATTPDRAERCLLEGIKPLETTCASYVTLARDDAYDNARPSEVAALGLTRANSVYAHLKLESAITQKNGGWLNRLAGEVAVLSIHVPEPDAVYVADGFLNAEPYHPHDYWASLTTLRHYLSQKRPVFVGPSQSGGNHTSRYFYMWPEVLLPGVIAPEQIQLVR